jgi:hypothetical protein
MTVARLSPFLIARKKPVRISFKDKKMSYPHGRDMIFFPV